MEDRQRPHRTRRARIARAAVLFVVVLGLLYTWDGSRQPASGNGWRLLLHIRGLGTPGTVQVLTDQAQVDDAWEQLRRFPPAPAPDFSRELVIWFVDGGTFGCRSRLDGMNFDLAAAQVTGRFGRGLVTFCDEEAYVPDSFLITVDRDRLPQPPYRVVLVGRTPPGEPIPTVTVGS